MASPPHTQAQASHDGTAPSIKLAEAWLAAILHDASIVGHGSTCVPMGCAETLVMRLPGNHDQAARDALAHRPRSACGSRRSLAVVPSIWIEGTTARLP